jgi:hypothetical protein
VLPKEHRVQAVGRKDVREILLQSLDCRPALSVCRRHYHGFDAGLSGACDHGFAIVVEAVIVEVHVAVDQ